MSGSRLAEWLRRIEGISPHEIELGLERVSRVLDALALRTPDLLLTVGGTNGKGSTVSYLHAMLQAGGARVGSFVSPHLHVYNERVRLGGRLASDEELVAAFERIDAARGDIPLTYFEYGAVTALTVFDDWAADAVVLEVGMGGRLDAVNAAEPDAVLISNVSLDHCDWLGDTVEEIAREKAGIMRRDKPVVFAGDVMPEAILDSATNLNAELLRAGRDYHWQRQPDGDWSFHGVHGRLDSLPQPALPGRLQVRNAAGALALLESVDRLPDPIAAAAIGKVSLPGRLQRIERDGREWLFDVAHNVASARALADELRQLETRETLAIIGLLPSKDADGILTELHDAADRWVAVRANRPAAVEASELAEKVRALTGRQCLEAESFEAAVRLADDQAPGRIVVCGSFFVVGPVQRVLGL